MDSPLRRTDGKYREGKRDTTAFRVIAWVAKRADQVAQDDRVIAKRVAEAP
jgi:hypothetical protein